MWPLYIYLTTCICQIFQSANGTRVLLQRENIFIYYISQKVAPVLFVAARKGGGGKGWLE